MKKDIVKPKLSYTAKFQNFDSNRLPLRIYIIFQRYFKNFQSTMQSRERIPKEIVEKYEDTICFMVDIDQCLMEVVELKTTWIMPMGYEVDGDTLNASLHLLIKPVNKSEERFGTYKEKSLSPHSKFTKPGMQRTVRKEVE